MGFEIPVDVDYFEHPKTLMLVGLVGNEADVYPLRLWRWCALYARDGFIKGGRSQIESAVKWNGESGKLHRALMKAGFLERDGKTVHDFMEHIGRAILLYENKKRKQREKYNAGILPAETGRIPPILDTQDEIGDPSSSQRQKTESETARRVREARERLQGKIGER